MTSKLAELAAIVAIALVLFTNSASISRGSYDDLAVLRAAAWLESCAGDDALPVRLSQHYEQYRNSLSKVEQTRYRLRADFSSNYALVAPLVRALDRAGRTPVLGNVVAACRLEHGLILLLVYLLLGRRQPWLLLALLASALPLAYSWPWDWVSWVPFQRYSLTWAAAAPRGAATLAWFGAVVAWVTLAGPRRIVTALGLLLASWLCHRSMALLCLAASVPPLALAALLRRRMPWPPTGWSALAAFFVCVLLAAGAKLGLLWSENPAWPSLFTAYGSSKPAEVRHAAEVAIAWTVLILAALELWRRSRVRLLSEPRAANLRVAGDALAWLLATTAAVCLGLNVAHPAQELWYGRLFFVWEACMRLGAIPHVLFFALLALTLAARATEVVAKLTLAAALLSALLAGREWLRIGDQQLPEQRRSLPKLLAKGELAYADEVQYYLSVANAVLERGCNDPTKPPSTL